MKRSGIDSMRLRYGGEIVVELEQTLDDGKPWAVRLRQPRPLVYLAAGEGIPIAAQTNGRGQKPAGQNSKNYAAMRYVVAKAICAVRETDEVEPGVWESTWTPVEVVMEGEPVAGADPRQMHIDEIDLPPFSPNVTRCWNALFKHAQAGAAFAGVEDATFREEGSRDAGDGREDVQLAAARAGAGASRRRG